MAQHDHERWSAINQGLDQALELPDAEREGWLERLGLESPRLVAQLRELLGQRARPDFASFLTGQPSLPLGMPDSGSLTGMRVGPYVLESELGSGGMGSVWLARRADGQYEGRAAIKFLHLAGSGREGRERFRREGQLLAKLAHPNIARLFDAGVLNDAQPYLVLEYVEGEQIHDYCDTRKLDLEARVRLMLDVLAAVSHAHRHLIIHRDIKPPNILVTHDGTVKLLDFGVARLLGEDPASAPTRAGSLVMTPQYAAPEQLLGEPVTTATDVHALGIVLYLLLTGKHPFADETSSPADTMRRILDATVRRPSAAGIQAPAAASRATTPARLTNMLRGDLDKIVGKALNRDPAARYPTVEAFAQDLKRLLAHQPISARADSLAYRARKFLRRHRGGVAAGVVVALVLVGATVVTTMQMLEARRQRDAALYQFKRAEFQARFAYQIMSEVGGDGQPITIYQLMEKGAELLEKNYPDDPRFVIGMLINMSGRYMDLGDTNREHAALVRAEGIARKLGDPDQIAFVQCNTVETELAAGRPEQAAERMRDGLANLARVPDPTLERRAECGTAQARLAWSQGNMDAAIVAARDVAELLEANNQSGNVRYISAASMLELLLRQEGRLREALEWNGRLIAENERQGREKTISMSATRQNRAMLFYEGGEVRAAFELQQSVVQPIAAREGVDHVPPGFATRMGLYQVRIEGTDAGLAWLERAAAATAAQGNQRQRMRTLLERARARLLLGHLDAVIPDLDTSESLARVRPGDNRNVLRGVRLLRAQLSFARGDAAAALGEVDGLLADIGYPARRVAEQLGSMLTLRARTQIALERHAEALATAKDALAVAEASDLNPEHSANVGAALMALSEAQRALGESANARDSAARAAGTLAFGLGAEHPETRAARDFSALN